jgi:hypothetical protein
MNIFTINRLVALSILAIPPPNLQCMLTHDVEFEKFVICSFFNSGPSVVSIGLELLFCTNAVL